MLFKTNRYRKKANTHSYEKRRSTLADYIAHNIEPWSLDEVAGKTFYHFGDNNYSSWTNFTDFYQRPVYNCAWVHLCPGPEAC